MSIYHRDNVGRFACDWCPEQATHGAALGRACDAHKGELQAYEQRVYESVESASNGHYAIFQALLGISERLGELERAAFAGAERIAAAIKSNR